MTVVSVAVDSAPLTIDVNSGDDSGFDVMDIDSVALAGVDQLPADLRTPQLLDFFGMSPASLAFGPPPACAPAAPRLPSGDGTADDLEQHAVAHGRHLGPGSIIGARRLRCSLACLCSLFFFGLFGQKCVILLNCGRARHGATGAVRRTRGAVGAARRARRGGRGQLSVLAAFTVFLFRFFPAQFGRLHVPTGTVKLRPTCALRYNQFHVISMINFILFSFCNVRVVFSGWRKPLAAS